MREISADYIFTGDSSPLKNAILRTNNNGQIIDIIPNTKKEITENVEFYHGIIVPAFINSHCHLELSHLKNQIPKNQGIINFIKNIKYLRLLEDNNQEKMRETDNYMYENGTSVVADICNMPDSWEIKNTSKILYHNFVETIGLENNRAVEIFEKAIKNYNLFQKINLNVSITAHASYSVSKNLFNLISEFAASNNSVLSFHNQEDESENDIFINNSGKLYDFIKFFMQEDEDKIKICDKTSLQYYLQYFEKNINNNIILVHNLFTSQQDIDFAKQISDNIYWCLCPNSNLFINNKLPNIDLLLKNNLKITIGTDSLASNDKLDMLEEMKTLQNNFPQLQFEEILSWATLNAAKALKIDDKFGTLESGKQPGVLLIENFNLTEMKLNKESKVKRLF